MKSVDEKVDLEEAKDLVIVVDMAPCLVQVIDPVLACVLDFRL